MTPVERLMEMNIIALGDLAGCQRYDLTHVAQAKIARYCALVAVGAIELPEENSR